MHYRHINRGPYMAVGQHQWYRFGVGAPPIFVQFSRDWDVHWGYGILTHGHMGGCFLRVPPVFLGLVQSERQPTRSTIFVGSPRIVGA